MNAISPLPQSTVPPLPDWKGIIQADGDSMAPTFTTGDLLEVDRRVKDVRGDGIYVFTLDGQLYIKALAMVPDGSLNVISHNPACPVFSLSEQDQRRMDVHGRVVKVWNGQRC